MLHTEIKYRVESLEPTEERLLELGAQPGELSKSVHYYAPVGKGVVKLVCHENGPGGDDCALHVLDERDGAFTLIENTPVANRTAGLHLMYDRGFRSASVVKMANVDYAYGDGQVGLYTINNVLRSVILDYPEGRHDSVKRVLGLGSAEQITVSYDRYLAVQGMPNMIALD